ncbi:chymotrypsin-2-like [Leptopilina heterotoma]|uniref:chymotrypsin-2-like n=1 Tax=Leptopilina heterotoma TaxID=63436 RepID=UPI001CA9F1C3|nr:chymotrypsin-2-like [Leptopilina heterotoma]XP_043461699.1 chymotrypsin-2-like [Leptopilina heterotoma]
MANLTVFIFLIFALTLSSAENKITARIVGGSEAQEEQFPYQVSLFDLFTGHFCGGSILNENWIITAGKCVQGKRPSSFYVGAGITNWSDLPYAIYQIGKVVVHDSQNIALIKLKEPLTFTAILNKIDLPTENKNVDSTPVVISGWGSKTKGGPTSRKLLFLNTKIVDVNTCKEHMSTLPSYPAITDENLCTFTRGGQGLCDGDSGNPVVSGNYLVGVSLYGYPCAQGYPDVSANVWNYIEWIKSHIN